MENVYLFELDSVIVSHAECKLAQEKLYMELMKGNTVVLSYNQILSITMFDLLDINQPEYTKKHILELIKKERICVSSYNGFKTPSAYISSKMGDGSPDFEYSCLRFLNDYPKNHDLIMNIKAVLEGKDDWFSPEDITGDELVINEKTESGIESRTSKTLSMDDKRILFDYINIIRGLTIYDFRKRKKSDSETNQASSKQENFDFEYYINEVTKAVVAKGNEHFKDRPELIKIAENNIEKMLETLKTGNRGIYRSTCLKVINEILDSDSDSIRLCKAILDMSYNYQVERSIPNITITHPMDEDSVAKTVADYYNRHVFLKPKEIELTKETQILAWNIVNDFCDPAEKQKEKKETNDCHLKNKLVEFTLKTILLIVPISIFIIIGFVVDFFAGVIIAIIAEFLLEFIAWCLPFDIGFFSVLLPIVNLFKHYRVYSLFKKGKPYYISVAFKYYIVEKVNNRWKKRKNISR